MSKRAKTKSQIVVPDPAQSVMPGIQPISVSERLAWYASLPMQPRCRQRPLDIGFWDTMRDQLDLF